VFPKPKTQAAIYPSPADNVAAVPIDPRDTVLALDGEPAPELFIRGSGLYSANLNAENPLGTMQSIEHTLRALDKLAEQEQ
jgi:hypothetical protein